MKQYHNLRSCLLATAVVISFYCTAQQKQVQYLSGTGSDHTVAWDFFCTAGRQSGYWTKIQVPSCWEQQGFGNYNYGRDYRTNGRNARFFDEKGVYRHKFTMQRQWKGKKIFIVFEGSMTDTEVKINGKSAGTLHQGAFYRFKYDITDKLFYDRENQLEVTVSKMSADASVNNAERLADYWVFGGIFRPVYLEAVPNEYIDYTGIDAKADGQFFARAFVKNIGSRKTLQADVLELNGRKITSTQVTVQPGDSAVDIKMKLQGIKTWTSETPDLYRVRFSLKENDKTVYQQTEKFGFRTIEIRRGDGIYLNGVQIKMKGTNRHCFWPETGRTLNDAVQLKDVQLLKEMNMNAVRCSHYPPDQKFLELCDSLGLYVLDELAGWQKWYNTQVGEKLVKEMVQRDLNHPSIIFWDNGNEGGTNKELDDDFVKWDVSARPVIHPHHRPGNDFNGIDCNHYEDYYSTQKILNDSLIYMPTEFLHSQDDGGAASGMADFWELHWHAKRSGGGFIWAMLDESVTRTDFNNVLDANGLNANDGILGPHREKEGSFFALREILSPVKIKMDQLPVDFSGSIAVENRYHFTNINQCSFQWAVVDYRNPYERFAGYTISQRGTASAPDIAPGRSGTLALNLPADFRKHDAMVLVAFDPFKKEIYKWIWKLKTNDVLVGSVVTRNDSVVNLFQTDTSYTMKSPEISISVNKRTGMLTQVRNSLMPDMLSFNKGPFLVQGNAAPVSSRTLKDKDGQSIEFIYEGNLNTVRWTMNGSGWVKLDYSYTLNGKFPFAGISFSYPENYILGAKWLGKGPYRQWKNRQAGTPVNVWANLYNNTQTGYSPVIYPEFKGYYGDITWMEFSTVQGKFYMATPDTGIAVRLFDFYGLTGPVPHPALPVGNISFLDCIPPIGTKLALNISSNTAALGPQSELTTIDRTIHHTLYFYFGLPKMGVSTEQYSRPVVDDVF